MYVNCFYRTTNRQYGRWACIWFCLKKIFELELESDRTINTKFENKM